MRIGSAKTVLFLILLLIAVTTAGYGFQIESVDLYGGMLWLGTASDQAAPSPVHWKVGAALPMSFTSLFVLSPQLNVFWDNRYTLTEDGTRAVPAEVERADQVNFLSIVLDAQAMFRFSLNEQISIGPLAFPAFVFRIPIWTWGKARENPEYKNSIISYLWGKARFFYMGVGGFFHWAFADRFGFAFQVKSRLPVFHIWDQEQLPFHDQMMVVASVGFKYYF
jgi:hypothetical protein